MTPIQLFYFADLPRLHPWVKIEGLTRDRQILTLISQGRSNKEIAAELGLANSTAKNRISVILRYLGVNSRTKAAVLAYDALQELSAS